MWSFLAADTSGVPLYVQISSSHTVTSDIGLRPLLEPHFNLIFIFKALLIGIGRIVTQAVPDSYTVPVRDYR